MKLYKIPTYALLSLVILSLYYCQTDSVDSPELKLPDNIKIPGATESSEIVDPNGGIVHFPSIAGNGYLQIPPGALDEPTRISIYALEESTPGRLHLGFEPSGLKFNIPVKLTIPYPLDDNESIPLIQFYHISEQNDLIDMGSEQLRWALYDNVILDEGAQTISGEMNHFSTNIIFFWYSKGGLFDIRYTREIFATR